ncbi:MAG: histidine kinase N-terminal 7TM domain-containing protein [Rhodosalinus sp.]
MEQGLAGCLATATPEAPALFVAGVMVGALVFLLWLRRSTHFYGKQLFTIANWALVWWLGAAALELSVEPAGCKLLFATLAYPGIALLPTAWVLFVYRYASGRTGPLPVGQIALLVGAPLVVTALAATNPLHEMFYAAGTGPRDATPGAPIVYEYGPFFFVAATYLYACLATAAGLLAVGTFVSQAPYRGHFAALFVLMVLPLAGNVLYVTRNVTIAGFDPTPLLFAGVLVVYAWLITVNGLFDLSWIARDLVFDELPNAYLIVAHTGQVFGANARAKEQFGIDPAEQRQLDSVPGFGPLLRSLMRQPERTAVQVIEIGDRSYEALPRPIYRPMGLQDPVMGWVLALTDVTDRLDRERKLEAALEVSARRAAQMALNNSRMRAEARTDSLTGLRNRRSLQEDISILYAKNLPARFFITVASIDLDHFKSINDTFGHDAGDIVLAAFAERLAGSFRARDRIYRLGGEEFIVTAEGLSKAEAADRLEGLRDTVLRMPECAAFDGLEVRFSAGLATWPDDHPDLDAVLRLADARLYRAKDAGRSQTLADGGAPGS